MKYYVSLSFVPTAELNRLAEAAEELGFDGVQLADHVVFPVESHSTYPYAPVGIGEPEWNADWPDPWVLVGALAARTERLRFLTGVYVLALRHPLLAAKAISTASHLAGGRVDVGVGAGWLREEFEAVQQPFEHRGKQTDEALVVLRLALQAESEFRHDGTYYRFGPLRPLCPAAAAPIPLLIGGGSPAAIRRAAELGDGWIAQPMGGREVETLDTLLELRSQSRRHGEPLEVIFPSALCKSLDDVGPLERKGVSGVLVRPWDRRATATQRLEAVTGFAHRFRLGTGSSRSSL